MKVTRRRFLQVLMAATATPVRGDRKATWHDQAFGARVSVTSRGPFAERLDRDASMILARLRELESIFSLYQPDSALSRLNATGELRHPPQELVDLLVRTQTLYRMTDGLFNPAIQTKWHALASGDPGWADIPAGDPHLLEVSSERVVLASSGNALTLNGIAQGYASDAIATLVRNLGYAHCLVNVGEFVAVGDDWRIGIAGSAGNIIEALTLSERAVATSSAAALEFQGQSHIMHPSGSVPPQWNSVSVVADNATLADGLSTALIHIPRSRIADLAGNMPLGVVHRIVLERADGQVIRFNPPGGSDRSG